MCKEARRLRDDLMKKDIADAEEQLQGEACQRAYKQSWVCGGLPRCKMISHAMTALRPESLSSSL